MKTTDRERNAWRLWAGVGVLVLAVSLPVGGIFLAIMGVPATQSALTAFLLVGGMPEIMCLVAIGILGGEHFGSAARPLRKLAGPASRLRYYGGLIGCLLNGLPLSLYAYAPWLMPDGMSKYYILAGADLVFIYSAFLMGGEFWEKFRSLFIWEGKSGKQNAISSVWKSP